MKKFAKITALVVFGAFAVTFAAYITNADMKLVEKIYDWLIAYHDGRRVEEHI